MKALNYNYLFSGSFLLTVGVGGGLLMVVGICIWWKKFFGDRNDRNPNKSKNKLFIIISCILICAN